MVKIGFIVGKQTDIYKYKITSKYAPIWLKKGVRDFKSFVNSNNTVACGVAIAAYINHKYKNAEITIFEGQNVGGSKFNLENCNKQQVLLVFYGASAIFHCGRYKTCIDKLNKFEHILNKTKAFVYPSPDFQKFTIIKPIYYKVLQKSGIPVVPFFSLNIQKEQTIKDIDRVEKKILKMGWNDIIIKPSYSGYTYGIKVFKNIGNTKKERLRKYLNSLHDKNYKNVTIQKFIPSFGKNYEIRTYWINGRYAYSVGTKTKDVEKGGGGSLTYISDNFKSEGGNLPDSLKRKLKLAGQKILKVIPRYYYKQSFLRIDFGCCLSVKNCPESYFVNEIEMLTANLLSEYTNYAVIPKLGNIFYKLSEKVKYAKNQKGVYTPLHFKNVSMCKN
jgi:hypothetical protein